MTALAMTLQAFFTDRLARQRQVSPNTLAAYRDTLRLLLVFAADKKGKEPSKLDIDDLDAPLIGAFLDDPVLNSEQFAELKHVSVEVNRRDSQRLNDERVLRH